MKRLGLFGLTMRSSFSCSVPLSVEIKSYVQFFINPSVILFSNNQCQLEIYVFVWLVLLVNYMIQL